MRNIRYIIILLAIVLSPSGCQRSESTEPNAVEVPAAVEAKPVEANAVRAVCELIFEGEFEAADDLIEQSRQAGPEFNQLAGRDYR